MLAFARGWKLACFALCLLVPRAPAGAEGRGDGTRALAASRVSSFGLYRGYSAPLYDGWTRSSFYVTARDGTRLAMDLFRPTLGGKMVEDPLPVVWTATPYRRAARDGGTLYTILDNYEWLKEILAHGYVVACVDVRGTGASFGTFAGMFSPPETDDGYDVTEWLAAQPWSNGRIGMYGESYLAITQFMTAGRRPPHLRAIVPSMGLTDVYDFVHKGGVDHTPLLESWGERLHKRDLDEAGTAAVDADAGHVLLRAALREHRDNRNPGEMYARLPYRDSVDPVSKAMIYRDWTPLALLEPMRASGVAIYQVAGWFDRYVRDQLLLFRNLPGPRRIAIGPWTHAQEDDHFAYAAEHLRWWDHWLRGVDNGVEREAPVHYFVIGAPDAESWRASETWPLREERRVRWSLSAGRSGTVQSPNDGALEESPPAEQGIDALAVDPTAGVAGNPRWTTEPAIPETQANDAKGLTYTSRPLPAALEIVGHPVAHLRIASSAKDADVFVYLEDVDGHGAARYVSEGMLRLSHRALAAAPIDDAGLPYHRGLEADLQPIEPGRLTDAAIELFPIAIRIRAGHRLRLSVLGADAPNAVPLPGAGETTLHIARGRAGSYLDLPILPTKH